ncbi:MAG: RluA family pseudouridine synthase [Lachnospiraceae bacterium]|nr:RluA family pseudouridine synthase [Lachnospiraceae bacterium]
MKKYEVIYEDSDLYVIRKSAGLACQSARPIKPDLMSLLKNECLERGEREPYLALVNRLDQPVEGLLLVAKNQQAAASLSAQARDHTRMEKEYQALVGGVFSEEKGVLVDFLLRDGRTNTSRVVPEGTKGAKRSELAYQVLSVQEDTSLLEIRLLTGRHHQIRVQLANAGHSIVGDFKYGGDAGVRQRGGASNAGFCRSAHRVTSSQLCLCASRLCFIHPRKGVKMELRTEPRF